MTSPSPNHNKTGASSSENDDELASMLAEVDVPLEDNISEACEKLGEDDEEAGTMIPDEVANPSPPPVPSSHDDPVDHAMMPALVEPASSTTTSVIPQASVVTSHNHTKKSPPPPSTSVVPTVVRSGGGTHPAAVAATRPSNASSSAVPPRNTVAAAPVQPPPPPPAAVVVQTKSKKKKVPPQSSSAVLIMGLSSKESVDKGENVGRWTAEEHRLFLQGLEQHGKGWKKIASLIKTRSVVQIRTHAQKYFQKLAKARQNGEEGDVTMEGRGGVSSAASVSTVLAAHTSKRRKPTTGTKRKMIQSIVASAQRQGKKMALAEAEAGFANPIPPLPKVAPILAHFILPVLSNKNNGLEGDDANGLASSGVLPSSPSLDPFSGPALEDSIFRFLSPAPVLGSDPHIVNDIARQAGANPITVPSSNHQGYSTGMVDNGEVSPTGVSELSIYPSWTDAKDTPSWYAKGSDVDALLEVGEALDWLTDTGDLNETYQPPSLDDAAVASSSDLPDIDDSANAVQSIELGESCAANNSSVATLPHIDSNVESVVPPLPSLFDGGGDKTAKPELLLSLSPSASDIQLKISPSAIALHDEHLHVFENPMEEQEFVSTILETTHESSAALPTLN